MVYDEKRKKPDFDVPYSKGVLVIQSDGDDQRISLGKFSFPGIFLGRKWKLASIFLVGCKQ